ncbi:MAG: mechanosensitive ion channel family protein [PVC group bacterium]
MSSYLPVISEIGLFVFILLFSFLVTIPCRRWAKRAEAVAGWQGAGRYLASRLAFPLAVLILSPPLFFLARRELAIQFPPGMPAHLQNWLVFWAALFFLSFLESLALQFYDRRERPFPIPALLRNIIRFVCLLLVLFAILRFGLGVDISPLLASTALLTAVIGFALQGVLGNLLAGMSLHLTRSVVPGDWISVGECEGRVIQTNWRETRLRTMGGHTIVVPNSVVSSTVVRNLSTPTPVRRHEINVGASYSDAPGEVIEALVSAALSVPEVLRKPKPTAYVTEYKDFGINYVLRYWSKRYYDRVPLDGDVSRMIWYEFKRRSIEIPFPMSDKLLNDFMAVVYRQRRLPPDDGELERRARALVNSELMTAVLVDGEGRPLLADEDARTLAGDLRFVRYTDGEPVFRQGEGGESCFIVTRGRLGVTIAAEDNLPAHEIEVEGGALVGEMTLLTGLPRTATVTARGEVELLEVSAAAFTRLLGLRPEIPDCLADLVADRAEKNAAALERLKTLKKSEVAESLKRENILRRFLHFLHPSS